MCQYVKTSYYAIPLEATKALFIVIINIQLDLPVGVNKFDARVNLAVVIQTFNAYSSGL